MNYIIYLCSFVLISTFQIIDTSICYSSPPKNQPQKTITISSKSHPELAKAIVEDNFDAIGEFQMNRISAYSMLSCDGGFLENTIKIPEDHAEIIIKKLPYFDKMHNYSINSYITIREKNIKAFNYHRKKTIFYNKVWECSVFCVRVTL